MIQSGLGHTIFPLAAVIEELAAGTLTARKIVDPVIERHVALVSSTRRPRTRAHQAIADLTASISRQLIVDGAWPGREASASQRR
jgi:LysR family transcriptional regulator, nitrogen assimilation regulatory protein